MSLIVVEGLSKSWSDKDVLRNVALTLSPREHVGLVGPNGHGKTTLLRILAGVEEATEGTIQRKSGLRIGYLPQDPPALEGSTLHQAMLDVFAPLAAMESDLHDMAAGMARQPSDERLVARYGTLQHEFEEAGGYSYHQRIEQILSGLEFPREVWDRPLSQLSGGQRTRAYVGRLLLEDPDILLLDEPTNHLDFQSVEWLEAWLQGFAGALIVVSHDRYFLDHATTNTWEVAYATLESYRGNYTAYLAQRQERFTERMRRWQAQQEFVEETQEFIRRFIAGQRSKEAQGRRTRLERFLKTEAIPRPRDHSRISVRFKVVERTGDFVLRLDDVQAGYEAARPLVRIESLNIQRGQRVAIVGPNGCGKTTLLRTVLGELNTLAGKVRWGANVRLGYISQTHSELSTRMTALEAVRQADPSINDERARSLLGSLLISEEDAPKPIAQLSGGQRSRVVLARLMLQKANVLVMDEPTNHLDINSQEVLQDVLSDFDGTIVFVSHDRYLIGALATHIWAMEGGTIAPIQGGWDKYLQFRDRQAAGAGGKGQPADAAKQQRIETYETRRDEQKERRKAANEVRKTQRQVERLEKEIHTLEAELRLMDAQIAAASSAGNVDEITRLGTDYAARSTRLRQAYAEWEQLGASLEENGDAP